jgi:hypothetical protein
MAEYRTDRSLAWRALMMGAVTGAGMVALLFLAMLVRDDGPVAAARYLPFLAFIFICAFAGWTVGLFALAAPAWWLLHRMNVRSLPAALGLGAIGAFLGHFGLEATGLSAINFAVHEIFSGDPMMQYDAWSSYRAALALSVVGVIVAAVIWRIAYRRVDRPA